MKRVFRLIILALFVVSLGITLWLWFFSGNHPGEEAIGAGIEGILSLAFTGILGLILVLLRK